MVFFQIKLQLILASLGLASQANFKLKLSLALYWLGQRSRPTQCAKLEDRKTNFYYFNAKNWN